MKSLGIALMFFAASTQTSLASQPKVIPAIFGAWAVDISRLPMPQEARPKSVTITFTAEKPDRLRTKVEVVDPTGNRLEADGVTPLNGSPIPVKSNFEADVSATSMPRPEVLIMQLAKDGSPASTRIYAVNPDGKTMIETVTFFGPDGQPVQRKNYFSRSR
jgi:hypothetical protein